MIDEQWQPVATAPEGERVVVFGLNLAPHPDLPNTSFARFDPTGPMSRWFDDQGYPVEPTHWRRVTPPRPDEVGDLEVAIAEFSATLPGWWFTVGSCSVSRDASCGPDRAHWPPAILRLFDEGFHCDDDTPGSTAANSLRAVTRQARAALESAVVPL